MQLLSAVLAVTAKTAPTEFRIFRAGVNKSEYGEFVFDEQSAEQVMAAYAAHGKPMVIDYNHGSTIEAPTPEQGKAAARSFRPEVRNGELWAIDIDWTESGRRSVESGEYTMFSPFFHQTKGRIDRLLNVGLTNLPALDDIEALVAASLQQGDSPMLDKDKQILDLTTENAELKAKLAARDGDTVRLTAAAGLQSSASGDDVRASVSGLVALRNKVLAATGKDNDSAALGTIEAWKTEAGECVRLKAEKAELELAGFKTEMSTILDQASKDGKVPPAQRESLERAALQFGGGKHSKEGLTWLKAHVEALGVVVGKDKPRDQEGNIAMSAADKQVARMLNISEKEWMENEKVRLAARA